MVSFEHVCSALQNIAVCQNQDSLMQVMFEHPILERYFDPESEKFVGRNGEYQRANIQELITNVNQLAEDVILMPWFQETSKATENTEPFVWSSHIESLVLGIEEMQRSTQAEINRGYVQLEQDYLQDWSELQVRYLMQVLILTRSDFRLNHAVDDRLIPTSVILRESEIFEARNSTDCFIEQEEEPSFLEGLTENDADFLTQFIQNMLDAITNRNRDWVRYVHWELHPVYNNKPQLYMVVSPSE